MITNSGESKKRNVNYIWKNAQVNRNDTIVRAKWQMCRPTANTSDEWPALR